MFLQYWRTFGSIIGKSSCSKGKKVFIFSKMMEQTAVTGFFPVVKNTKSSFSSHPAKRRKIEEVPLDAKHLKKVRCSEVRNVKLKNTRKNHKKNGEMTLSTLLTASPVLKSSETTSVTDEHKKRKRKSSKKYNSPTTGDCETVAKEINVPVNVGQIAEKKISNVRIDPWISEQAKLVLAVGRGCAAIQASNAKVDSSNPKSLKASDVFKQANASNDNENRGNVREEYLKKFHENVKSAKGKGKLRQKYSHLLDAEVDSPQVTKEANLREDAEQKSSPRVPAHQRFKQLASKTTEKSFLLPQKYKLLLEMFRTVDSVLFLLHRRSETCTFERLKKSVQSMLGRKFSEKHLAQMKTVLPTGLIFRIEKNLRDLNGMPSKPQLTIDAHFEEAAAHQHVSKADLNQTVLITRRNLFETSLVDITKKHHQKYLKKLNLKISDDELQRWHPHFKLDEVPDIEEALLPQAVVAKTVTSVKEILGRNHCIPQVEKALEKVLESSSEKEPSKSISETNKCKSKETASTTERNGILKGVSSSLLERIKEKEKKKAESAMLRDPKQERRLAMMDRLPDVVRVIKTYFTTEKKAAIPIEDCVKKISQSFGTGISTSDLEEQINLLHELAPEWLLIALVRKCHYVKISKTTDVNNVLRKLEKIKEQERNK